MMAKDLTPGLTYQCDNIGRVELIQVFTTTCLIKEPISGEVVEVPVSKLHLIEKL